jgi:hypothetical protein
MIRLRAEIIQTPGCQTQFIQCNANAVHGLFKDICIQLQLPKTINEIDAQNKVQEHLKTCNMYVCIILFDDFMN